MLTRKCLLKGYMDARTKNLFMDSWYRMFAVGMCNVLSTHLDMGIYRQILWCGIASGYPHVCLCGTSCFGHVDYDRGVFYHLGDESF